MGLLLLVELSLMKLNFPRLVDSWRLLLSPSLVPPCLMNPIEKRLAW